MRDNITSIAYYLGQFHPNNFNDEFWGKGFTEWHNVAKARPLFSGHNQPVLPGGLGFYDLRNKETLIEQFELALSFGVNCFCHWHYWFEGQRLLNGPFESMMSLKEKGPSLMLGWANESWTGIWHGLSNKILLEQKYNRQELDEHAKVLANYFNQDRYLKLEDKSPFLIYKPNLIPDSKNYLDELRARVRYHGGGDIYLIGTWGPGAKERIENPECLGYDAVVANNVGAYISNEFLRKFYLFYWSLRKKINLGPEVRKYLSTVETLKAAQINVQGVVHNTVITGWDNTPRSGRRGLVLTGFDKNSFQSAIRTAMEFESKNDFKLLFVKSWNEWAEGNMMEPVFKESWSVGEVYRKTIDG